MANQIMKTNGGNQVTFSAYMTSTGIANKVNSIIGFRNKDLVILEDEFVNVSDNVILLTDDGSKGRKGLVTNALEELINEGNEFDLVIAIGPLIMMKYVVEVTKKYNIKKLFEFYWSCMERILGNYDCG